MPRGGIPFIGNSLGTYLFLFFDGGGVTLNAAESGYHWQKSVFEEFL